jgi:hypothetical protein
VYYAESAKLRTNISSLSSGSKIQPIKKSAEAGHKLSSVGGTIQKAVTLHSHGPETLNPT